MARKSKKKTKSATVKKTKRTTKSMARKKTSKRRYTRAKTVYRRAGKSRGKFGSFLSKGILGETIKAYGAGKVGTIVSDRVMPQATPFVSAGAEYAAGGVKGLIGAELLKMVSGEQSLLSSFGGFFGGGNQSQEGGLSV